MMSLLAPVPAQADKQGEPAAMVVEGKVKGLVMTPLYEPLPAATVEVRNRDQKVIAKTTTDLAGEFSLSGLPLETLFFCATADGQDWSFVYQTPSADPLRPTRVQIRCFDAATVVGIVKDADGKPVAGAQVTGSFDSSRHHDPAWVEFAATVTDAKGHYTLAKVPLGDISLRVSAGGFEFHETSIYLRGNTTADLVLQLGDGRSVQIAVQGVPEDRLSEVRCYLELSRHRQTLTMPQRLVSGSFDADGIWDLRGLPEDVDLNRIRVFGPGLVFEPTSISLKKGSEEPILFKVAEATASGGEKTDGGSTPKTAVFRGQVINQKGKPVTGIDVRIHSGEEWIHATTAADGSFSIRGDFKGREYLSLSIDDADWVLMSNQRRGFSSNFSSRRTWFRFDTKRVLKVRVTAAATVSGSVVDRRGKPVAEAWVTLQSEVEGFGFGSNWERSYISSTMTDGKGVFIMGGLPEMTNRMYLTIQDDRGIADKGPLKGRGKKTLKAIKLRLIKPATVEGTVLAPGGKPMPGARVQLLSWDIGKKQAEVGTNAETITDRQGRFLHRGLKAGEYALKVRLRGMNEACKTVAFKLGKSRTVKRKLRLRKR